METYRQLHEVRDRMQDLQRHLRSAILADTTEEMTRYGGDAQSLADGLLGSLRDILSQGPPGSGARGEKQVEWRSVDAAANSLNLAWGSAERIALGTNVSEMRAYLVDMKTHTDFAEAYVHAALGMEME
jgi:hypothetical protein